MYILSLVIPIYNVELYIKECFESVLSQLTSDVEIIFINDGTLDNSAKIIEDLISDYSQKIQNQVLLIAQNNQGLSGARNTGLKYATGKYIGFLDSDDKLLPNYIETILKTVSKGDFDIIDFNLITSNGEVREIRQGNTTSLESVFRAGLWYSCTRVFKKSMFDQHKFTPNIYYEDLALTPILYAEAGKTFYINEPLYWYRINSDGITLNQSLESNRKTLKSFEYILNQYIDLYKDTNNKYYAFAFMQCYYLLCTSALLRFNLIESFKIISKYKLLERNLISKNILSNDRTLKKRIYLLYKYPHSYLTLFGIIYYLKNPAKLAKVIKKN